MPFLGDLPGFMSLKNPQVANPSPSTITPSSSRPSFPMAVDSDLAQQPAKARAKVARPSVRGKSFIFSANELRRWF